MQIEVFHVTPFVTKLQKKNRHVILFTCLLVVFLSFLKQVFHLCPADAGVSDQVRDMKTVLLLVIGIILGLTAMHGLASDGFRFSDNEEVCYAEGMIGLDSVINARLGVHAEEVLVLAQTHNSTTAAPRYVEDLLRIIYGAYLWEGDPHGYAMRIFHQCAVRYLNGGI